MPAQGSDSGRATTPAGIRPRQSFASYRDSGLGIFALLLAFRIVNAVTLRTFFQPDEFFQSLEPAWQLAFGQTSHAWITWVGFSLLTTTLHPSPALSHDNCRSGKPNCGRPYTQEYLRVFIWWRQKWHISVV